MVKNKDNLVHLSDVIAKKNKILKVENNNKKSNRIFNNLSQKEHFELTVQLLLSTLKCKDEYTWGHSLRVAYFCITVGKELNLSEEELYELEIAALFHDLGKIGVPDLVLQKPARLTEPEFKEMKLHPVKSFEILKNFPIFLKISEGVKFHHERFDGNGYPEGLKGEKIPLFSRIILISDTFDAMTSTRPYRKGMSFEVAFQELIDFKESQFDPKIVDLFIKALKSEQTKNEDTFKLQLVDGIFKKDAA